MRVCTLGDLLLDVIVQLDRPLQPADDVPAAIRAGAGGQAANVAAWAAALGAGARFVGTRACDAAASVVAAELGSRGVELAGPVVVGRTGVVVSFVAPDGERSMASDRGVSPELRAEELDERWFRDCDVLCVSGYCLFASPIAEAAACAAEIVHDNGGRVGVDLSAWTSIRAIGRRFRDLLTTVEPDVVFATEREWEALGGGVPYAVVKRGAAGCTVVDHGAREDHAALPADVVDATGAGDALAAGFLVGGVELGLEAAARCVARVGAMP